jgi:hypothetical protein
MAESDFYSSLAQKVIVLKEQDKEKENLLIRQHVSEYWYISGKTI